MYKVSELYTVYGTEECEYCQKTKVLLDHYNKNWRFVNIMEKKEYLEAFKKKTNNASKVPQVCLYQSARGEYEVHIGGYNDLQAWLDGSYQIRGQHTRPVTNEWKGLI